MDPQLGLQMQSLGLELNTVLARFHAVSRHAPSLAAAPDGALEAVPCSVIDSWEVQLQKRLDACELDKQAAVQRCNREKEEVVADLLRQERDEDLQQGSDHRGANEPGGTAARAGGLR